MVENYSLYKDKGLTGLANIGNTCYINSCMQLLSHTYELNDFLNINKRALNQCVEAEIYKEWNGLRTMLWSENCTIAPYRFIKSIQEVARVKDRELFTGFGQNDVFEFLLFIIDCLHESLKREVDMTISGNIQNNKDILAKKCYEMMKSMYTKEYSEILNIFYGISVTQIKDFIDDTPLSATCEPCSILSLEIPTSQECSIYDCFVSYTKDELLHGENAWLNDKTNSKQDVNKQVLFWKLPNVLIIELKRYNSNLRKIHTVVNTPLKDIDFSDFVVGYDSDNSIYDLFGTGNHSGNVQGGHYSANILNANGKWYNFNDTFITSISEDKVITPHTYCLFYRKKNKA